MASYGGIQPSRIFEPHVVGSPSVASTSLTAIGTPSSRDEHLALRAALVGGARRGERALGVDVQEGVDLAVDGGDAVEERLRDLDAGRLPEPERLGQLARRCG